MCTARARVCGRARTNERASERAREEGAMKPWKLGPYPYDVAKTALRCRLLFVCLPAWPAGRSTTFFALSVPIPFIFFEVHTFLLALFSLPPSLTLHFLSIIQIAEFLCRGVLNDKDDRASGARARGFPCRSMWHFTLKMRYAKAQKFVFLVWERHFVPHSL